MRKPAAAIPLNYLKLPPHTHTQIQTHTPCHGCGVSALFSTHKRCWGVRRPYNTHSYTRTQLKHKSLHDPYKYECECECLWCWWWGWWQLHVYVCMWFHYKVLRMLRCARVWHIQNLIDILEQSRAKQANSAQHTSRSMRTHTVRFTYDVKSRNITRTKRACIQHICMYTIIPRKRWKNAACLHQRTYRNTHIFEHHHIVPCTYNIQYKPSDFWTRIYSICKKENLRKIGHTLIRMVQNVPDKINSTIQSAMIRSLKTYWRNYFNKSEINCLVYLLLLLKTLCLIVVHRFASQHRRWQQRPRHTTHDTVQTNWLFTGSNGYTPSETRGFNVPNPGQSRRENTHTSSTCQTYIPYILLYISYSVAYTKFVRNIQPQRQAYRKSHAPKRIAAPRRIFCVSVFLPCAMPPALNYFLPHELCVIILHNIV